LIAGFQHERAFFNALKAEQIAATGSGTKKFSNIKITIYLVSIGEGRVNLKAVFFSNERD